MKQIHVYEEVFKKSRFIAYMYEIDSVDEAKDIINNLLKEHKKARHIPYAYKIDGQAKKSDDKEPNGTAGMPIYNIIEKKNLNHVLICVVRYFGGIKLGAGGLTRAYSNTVSNMLKDTE